MVNIKKVYVFVGLMLSLTNVPAISQELGEPQTATPAAETSPSKLAGEVSIKQDKNPFKAEADEKTGTGEAPAKSKHSLLHNATAKGKSLANFVFDLRGFDWSKEGANVISDTNINPKDEAAKEYLFRKKCDEQEVQKTALMMQLAMFVDNDPIKSNQSLADLEKLIGKEQANDTYCAIRRIHGENLDLKDQRLQLDFSQKRTIVGQMLETAAASDPILIDVSKRLAKYNHRSKLIQYTAKVMYSTLGLATFTPTLVAPIAEATLLTFMMATGGPEQDKLLKEIYLGKIMQSRCNMLNEKAHIVTESMDMALLTKNKRLLACTKALIKDLANDQTASTVVGPFRNSAIDRTNIVDQATTVPKSAALRAANVPVEGY